ncbi:MAG TPA: alpha-hydroxy-acid oxidizing protein [Gaiellaceae bacterium]|nr:alpha-hydroxy-acid oxidizing protein [Gaiellaceae bacterium]
MPAPGFGRLRQSEVYVGGARGRMPRVPFGPEELEAAARRRMSRAAFAYVAGGAGAELTVKANRAAFERWHIVPRMLRDISQRDTSVELLGRRLHTPFLLAPVGVLELAYPEADLAVARAAAAESVPMIFSNQASRTMEACAAEMGDCARWFQLYASTSDELIDSLLARAAACGCEAIVLTLDTTQLGWRTRDLDLAYLPFLRGKGIAQYTSDPVFQRLVDDASPAPAGRVTLAALRTLISLTRSYPGGLWSNLRSLRPRLAVQVFTDVYSRASLAWDDVGRLLERAPLPLLLKGILHPDDAERAVRLGVAGIVVSNHGGRQVDGSIATLDALPPIVDVVGRRIPVLFDSGVRTGADVLKALALGATAVLLGRPYVYGLALAGEDGVRDVIRNLLADFDLTLALSGHASVADLGPDALARD